MKREKKRPDYLVLAYKYTCRITGQAPEILFTTAKAMQALWNSLVEAREKTIEKIKAEPEISKEDKKALWESTNKQYLEITKGSDLNWECKEEVFNKFMLAVQGSIKSGKGSPNYQRRLEYIKIPHRFTGGGIPISQIFDRKRGKRINLKSVPSAGFENNRADSKKLRISRGSFGIDSEELNISVYFHRPIPEGAVLKNCSFLGVKSIFGWEWSIVFTVEEPPPPERVLTLRACAIDLGWRKFEDYIRVAMITDTDGNIIECKLPLNTESKMFRQYNSRHKAEPLCVSVKDIMELESKIGTLVENCKAQVKEIISAITEDLPTEIKLSFAHIAKMRQGGLIRFQRMLNDWHGDIIFSTSGEKVMDVINAIETWKKQNDRYARQLLAANRRFVNLRKWYYNNIARWLCTRYDLIAWESDLNVKEMAEAEDKNYALKAADRYRQLASIGDLRIRIQNASVKHRAQIVPIKTAGTSRTCFYCHGAIVPSAKLIVQCENEHKQDQDINSAKFILSQVDQDKFTFLEGSKLQKSDLSIALQKCINIIPTLEVGKKQSAIEQIKRDLLLIQHQ